MTDGVIVPRWEWRTFAQRFAPAVADTLPTLASDRIEENDETYLLAAPTGNVKVRSELMDVKVLRETGDAGLERWAPVLKAPFPLSRADVDVVFGALGVPIPQELERDIPLDRLLELVLPTGRVRRLDLHKRRMRTTLRGCMAEMTDVTTGERSVRTIAVESEDPAAVLTLLHDLHLDPYVNTSYPRGLAWLVEGAAERYAVIDIGTNSVKLHVAERSNGDWRPVADRAVVTRLGERLQETAAITEDAASRTAEAIGGMVEEARREDAVAIVAVGTAGLRFAANRDDVLETIRSRAGVTVEVIPGEEEARLAYLAVVAGLDIGDEAVVVFDTGGGSSQFTFGRGPEVDERFSLEVGAARYTERFRLDGAVDEGTLQEAYGAIEADLARLGGHERPDALVGMGGAVTNLTAVSLGLKAYDPERVHGATLERSEVERQIERYRPLDAEARRSIVGLQPKRAEVILAGACIVRTVMEQLGHAALTVSDRGLRHGVLAERFGR